MNIPLKIKKILISLSPKYFINLYVLYKIKRFQAHYPKVISEIKNKDKIKVAFFIIHSSVWKYDGLFQLMLEDDKFDPIVVICPYIVYGQEIMLRELKLSENFISSKGHPYVMTLNFETDEWLDVKQKIKPDIIFFTNPHKLTKDEYYIHNFVGTLTCYVPYGFLLANIQQAQFNQLFHNLCWKIFCETPIHVELAQKYARNKGCNVIFTGFPLLDELIDTIPQNDPWKKQDKVKKKIIWAPHHTIENNERELAYSCFFLLFDLMFVIAKKYSDKIQIAFKPHPILKSKLYKHPAWGKNLTDKYYQEWKNLSNGQLEENDYIDLFLTSDAMILDSISFMAEYMTTKKPSLFTVRDDTIRLKFNEFGQICYELFYKTTIIEEDIVSFIENVVILKKDTMKDERMRFIQKYLMPPHNKSASENIYNYIKNII